MKSLKEIKALPNYLQPKILSAVAFINSASPNINKAVERINRCNKHLSEREMYGRNFQERNSLYDLF